MRRRLQRAETRPRLDVVRVLVRAAPGLVVVRRHGREVVRGARAGVQAPSLAVVGRAAEARGGGRRGHDRGREEAREGASHLCWGQQDLWILVSVPSAPGSPSELARSSRQLL